MITTTKVTDISATQITTPVYISVLTKAIGVTKQKFTISLRLALAVFTIVLVIASAVPPSAILLTSSTKSLNIAKDTLLDTLQYRMLVMPCI